MLKVFKVLKINNLSDLFLCYYMYGNGVEIFVETINDVNYIVLNNNEYYVLSDTVYRYLLSLGVKRVEKK